MSWQIFAGRAFCINLVSRPDRQREVSQELHEVGLLPFVEFYNPVKSSVSGAVGCYTSHVTVMRMAQERNLPWVLVLEDDLRFDRDRLRQHLNHLVESLARLQEGNDDWDVLYLGHNPVASGAAIIRDGEFLIYRTSTMQTHAYIANLRSEKMKDFIGQKLPTADLLDKGNSIYHIDNYFGRTMRQLGVYPMFVFQKPESKSDNDWGVGEQWRGENHPDIARLNEELVVRYPFPVMQTYAANWGPHRIRRALHGLLGKLTLYPLKWRS
jgi:hypothetical protein